MSKDHAPSPLAKLLFWGWLTAAVAFAAYFVLQPVLSAKPVPAAPAAKVAVKVAVKEKTAAAPAPVRLGVDAPGFNPDGSKYALLAWTGEGLRFLADGEPYVTLRLPMAGLRAQLVERGDSPRIVTDGVEIRYALEAGFERPSRQSRLWEFSEYLLGLKLAPDQGVAAGPSGTLLPNAELGLFEASGLPVLPYGDAGYNPSPMVTVQARDQATGRILAETKAALPVSTTMGCRNCHGGPWRRDLGGMGAETGENVLAAHDRDNGTDLLARAKSGAPTACQKCHADASEKAEGDPTLISLSSAVHGWHAAYMGGRGADACAACHPAGGQGGASMRDLHAAKGLTCDRCHGSLETVAASALKADQAAGRRGADKVLAALALPAGGPAPRQPWISQPDCSGCHDFATKPRAKTASAVGKLVGGPGQPLFRDRRDDMDKMACQACHGLPHALYPSRDPVTRDRDNVQAVQYQGLARPLGANGNCQVCHTADMDVSAHHPLPEVKTVAVAVPAGAESKRPRVSFPHGMHEDLDCRTCHHKGYVEGVKQQTCSTAGCHDLAVPATVEESSGWKYYRNAFHGPGFSCNACHQAMRKAGKATGPVECKSCHIEK